MTISTIGGILLIIGALLTYKGKVYAAVLTYIFADLCWIYLSYLNSDVQGAVLTSIGTFLGILAFLKMKTGKMRKTLDK